MNADDELAARALQQAADACGLDVVQRSTAWKTRYVARIEGRDGSAYAFKYFRSPAIAAKESSILLHLSDAAPACKVQELLLCKTGEALASTELGPIMVSRWIEGVSKSYDQVDVGTWAVLGRSLAALHQALRGFRCSAAESLSAQLLCLEIDGERIRIANDREALRSLGVPTEALNLQDARIHLMEAHLEPCVSGWPKNGAQLIHNDYNVHNYLFGDEGELAVIDWDRSLYAPKEYEVVRCLNHLPLESPSLASAFLAGYAEAENLDEGALEWAVHAAMVSHASKHWPIELALAGAPAAIARLVALEKIVSRLTQDGGKLSSFFSERAGKGPGNETN